MFYSMKKWSVLDSSYERWTPLMMRRREEGWRSYQVNSHLKMIREAFVELDATGDSPGRGSARLVSAVRAWPFPRTRLGRRRWFCTAHSLHKTQHIPSAFSILKVFILRLNSSAAVPPFLIWTSGTLQFQLIEAAWAFWTSEEDSEAPIKEKQSQCLESRRVYLLLDK